MATSGIERVTVLGGGVLGSQIAWHSAFRGKTVTVFDVEAAGIASCQRLTRSLGPFIGTMRPLVTNRSQRQTVGSVTAQILARRLRRRIW